MTIKYELLYFKFHGMARVCRLLLDMSGENWNDCYPKVNMLTWFSIGVV
jgi:hypothetical protein